MTIRDTDGNPLTAAEALDACESGEEFAAVLGALFAGLDAAREPEGEL